MPWGMCVSANIDWSTCPDPHVHHMPHCSWAITTSCSQWLSPMILFLSHHIHHSTTHQTYLSSAVDWDAHPVPSCHGFSAQQHWRASMDDSGMGSHHKGHQYSLVYGQRCTWYLLWPMFMAGPNGLWTKSNDSLKRLWISRTWTLRTHLLWNHMPTMNSMVSQPGWGLSRRASATGVWIESLVRFYTMPVVVPTR